MSRFEPLLALLMLTGILVVGQLYLTIPLTGDISGQFAVTSESASWAGTAFGFAYACGFLVFGPLSDRTGRRIILLGGLTGLAVATALLSFAANLPQFLLGRAVQGFIAASFPPVALSVVAGALPLQKRPLGISLMSFAFLVAAPVSQYLGAVIPALPTRIMLISAPLYLLMAAGLFRLLPKDQPAATQTVAEHSEGRLAGLLRNQGVVSGWLAALTVLFGFVSFQVGTVLMAQAGGADAQIIRLAGLPPLALSLFAGKMSQRFTPSLTGRIGMGIAALGLITAILPGAIPAAAMLVSAGIALAVPGLIAMIAGAAQDRNRGLALSFYTFCLFVGASVAPPVATALYAAGLPALFGLPAMLLVVAVAAVALAGTRKPAPSSHPRPVSGDS